MNCHLTNYYLFNAAGLELEDATDDGIKYLVEKHPEIEMVLLSFTKLTHIGLKNILSLPNLSSLTLFHIKIQSDQVFYVVSRQLQTLNLVQSLEETHMLSIVENCKESLQSLKINSEKQSPNFVSKIFEICEGCGLRSLVVPCSKELNFPEINCILPCLTNLELGPFKKLRDNGLIQILKVCGTTLTHLALTYNKITGEKLKEFKGTLPCLKYLDLSYTDVTDVGLLNILDLCGNTIESLILPWTKVTGEGLSEHKGILSRLSSLDLSHCIQLSDKGFLQFLNLCGGTLSDLDLIGTKVTGENLTEYNGILPCLSSLNLYNCQQVTDTGFLNFLNLCGSTLVHLNIGDTTGNISGENLSDYKGSFPRLKTIEMNGWSPEEDDFLELNGRTLKNLIKRLRLRDSSSL